MNTNKTAERVFTLLLFTVAFFVATESRGEEKRHEANLSVKAKIARNQDDNETDAEKVNGFVTTAVKTKTETCTLEITVENTTEQNDSYRLEWFFISKKTSGKENEKLLVFNSGKADIVLDGSASVTRTEVSKPFIYTKKTVYWTDRGGGTGNSRETNGGDVYAGYLVLVKADGELLEKESNSSRFLTDEWVAQCEQAAQSPAAAKK